MREAKRVLASVRQLSDEIVENAQKWHANASPMQDGALAMTTFSTPAGSSTWVPSEDITANCPGLKLADYQVVGVNWLIMLSKVRDCARLRATTLSRRFARR